MTTTRPRVGVPFFILSINVLLTLACAPPPTVEAPTTGSTSLASYRQARAVVTRALDTMGHAEQIRTLGGLFLHAQGEMDRSTERQGKSPATFDRAPFAESFAVDLEAAKIAYEYRHDRSDGTYEWIRETYAAPDRRLILVLEATPSFAVNLTSPEYTTARHKLLRRLPNLLLEEVLRHPAALRSLGQREGHEVVAGRLESGETVSLLFDAESGVLAGVEYLTDVQTFGDTTITWRFDAYQPLTGLGLFPRRYGVAVNGRPFTTMQVETLRTGPTAVAPLFAMPADIVLPAPRSVPPVGDPAGRATVREVAPGVHIVDNLRGGFHPMFIELDDAVVALDAPAGYRLLNELPAGDVAPSATSAWLAERYLQLIEDTIPDKPVRHVVLTHFHNDHVGGLRAFVAAGATVVAPAADRAAIDALVRAPHTLAPDRLAAAPRPLDFVGVEDTYIFDDGSRKIEIFDVGANPHSDHMLVVHLPAEGILFVSDLLDARPLERFPAPNHAALDRFFATWLSQRGLAPQQIFTMHGGEPATPQHLEKLRGEPSAASATVQ